MLIFFVSFLQRLHWVYFQWNTYHLSCFPDPSLEKGGGETCEQQQTNSLSLSWVQPRSACKSVSAETLRSVGVLTVPRSHRTVPTFPGFSFNQDLYILYCIMLYYINKMTKGALITKQPSAVQGTPLERKWNAFALSLSLSPKAAVWRGLGCLSCHPASSSVPLVKEDMSQLFHDCWISESKFTFFFCYCEWNQLSVNRAFWCNTND